MLRTKRYAATADSARSQYTTQILAGQCCCYRANAPSELAYTELDQLGSTGFVYQGTRQSPRGGQYRVSIDGRGVAPSWFLLARLARRAPRACGLGMGDRGSRPRPINRSQGYLKETIKTKNTRREIPALGLVTDQLYLWRRFAPELNPQPRSRYNDWSSTHSPAVDITWRYAHRSSSYCSRSRQHLS